jgi:hypothetical protein
MPTDDAKRAVKELFSVTPSCYGHCKEVSAFEFRNDSMIVQVCPSRYVSRIVAYGSQVDPNQFTKVLLGLAQRLEGVESSDIRIASRYAWDLGIDRENDDLIVRLAYWTQNYRRTKNESTNRAALFLCSNKDSFFMQSVNSKNKLCLNCRNPARNHVESIGPHESVRGLSLA